MEYSADAIQAILAQQQQLQQQQLAQLQQQQLAAQLRQQQPSALPQVDAVTATAAATQDQFAQLTNFYLQQQQQQQTLQPAVAQLPTQAQLLQAQLQAQGIPQHLQPLMAVQAHPQAAALQAQQQQQQREQQQQQLTLTAPASLAAEEARRKGQPGAEEKSGPFFSFDAPVEKLLPPTPVLPVQMGKAVMVPPTGAEGKAPPMVPPVPAQQAGQFFSFDAPVDMLKAGDPHAKMGRPAPPVAVPQGAAASGGKWVTVEERTSRSRSRSKSRRRRRSRSSSSSSSPPPREAINRPVPGTLAALAAANAEQQQQQQQQQQLAGKVGFQLSKPTVEAPKKAEKDDATPKHKRVAGTPTDAVPAYSAQSVFAQFQQQMQGATKKDEGKANTFDLSELLALNKGKDGKEDAEKKRKDPLKPKTSGATAAALSLVKDAQRTAHQQQLQDQSLKHPPPQQPWEQQREQQRQSSGRGTAIGGPPARHPPAPPQAPPRPTSKPGGAIGQAPAQHGHYAQHAQYGAAQGQYGAAPSQYGAAAHGVAQRVQPQLQTRPSHQQQQQHQQHQQQGQGYGGSYGAGGGYASGGAYAQNSAYPQQGGYNSQPSWGGARQH